MTTYQTILSKQEKKWILDRRVTRISDNKEVQIYPMGAERYLSSALFEQNKNQYNIRADIKDKDVLVIPGYGNSCFLFAQAGAKSIAVYDKDPVTIAWIKAFKKYFHYRERTDSKSYPSIGELLTALTSWYPPLIALPSGKFINALFWAIHPNSLRRTYIHYMVSLVRQAIQSKSQENYELDKNIQFHAATLNKIIMDKEKQVFDTAFVPYLLGVENGIEKEQEIVDFIKQLTTLVPNGHILVTPSRNSKDFYVTGKRYFITTPYENLQTIPGLSSYVIGEDKNWFRTQGLAVFGSPSNTSLNQ
ncbi:hypothetical protein [Legionella micdadei]|uniref:Uncharacterized protein n=1 Tax=Legionella micdadei TaxID=451 RepID=A0A098GEG2_LEGMI|nr:hypothetical protein [Legionella micdadei]ARG97568.1 ABC transporter permease [Legionella micdadei]ARH00119.1 ABC transporter permease [Legionella micdadei]KTD27646.1 ABC transporter permease [Legionella micdadei]NSL17630.1 ABC transporter permease [Legionella micdadei]CEG60868.1 conserved protein of unknown function [Legionella micdadei]